MPNHRPSVVTTRLDEVLAWLEDVQQPYHVEIVLQARTGRALAGTARVTVYRWYRAGTKVVVDEEVEGFIDRHGHEQMQAALRAACRLHNRIGAERLEERYKLALWKADLPR